MIVAIHQPNYAPWLGYFHKMRRADVFVLLDDVDFSKNSYINRVRIQGNRWLSVPVNAHLGIPIKDVRLADPRIADRHRGILGAAYPKRPQVEEFVQVEQEAINSSGHLIDLNIAVLEYLRARLHISTPCVRSSYLGVQGTSTMRLVSMVSALGGDVYLSGSGGRNYQDERLFEAAGIAVQYRSVATQGTDPSRGYSALHALFAASDARGGPGSRP